MAEKKKRFRPTLTAYRELEKKVNELKIDLEHAVFVSNEVRNANDRLSRELNTVKSSCKDEISTLEKSNELMEQELTHLRKVNASLRRECKKLGSELLAVRSRGFWARVFNK